MENRLLKILVTGSDGMVGSAVQRISSNMDEVLALLDEKTLEKVKKKRIIFRFVFMNRQTLDLTNKEAVYSSIGIIKPDVVLHLAAKVGGLFANQGDNAGFYFQNIKMSENILGACYKHNINYTFSFLSTCIYPNDPTMLPYTETNLHAGEPHPSNYGYAFAKRQHEVMCRLYNELGQNNVCLIPNNLYGPNDNFDVKTAHVIPAIINKAYLSSNKGTQLSLPGSGLALREFTYVDDIAKQALAYMLYYMNSADSTRPKVVNIGNNEESSIYKVLEQIHKSFENNGIKLNSNLHEAFKETSYSADYDGIFRKPSNLSILHTILPKTKQATLLADGLDRTIKWFIERNKQ